MKRPKPGLSSSSLTSIARRAREMVRLLLLPALLIACGGKEGPSQPPGAPGLRVISGAGVADSIETRLAQPLVVEVRDTDGRTVSGAEVRFVVEPLLDTLSGFRAPVRVCPLADTTCAPLSAASTPAPLIALDTSDGSGRASVRLRLGAIAGPAHVRVEVPLRRLVDSALYTVKPGAAVRVRAAVTDVALDSGTTTTVRGNLFDRFQNLRADGATLSTDSGSVLTLDSVTGVVSGRSAGLQYIQMRSGRSFDSTRIRVIPVARLLVWNPTTRTVVLVNMNGRGAPLSIRDSVASRLGVFPRFTPERTSVTFHLGLNPDGADSDRILVVDTSGSVRRSLSGSNGFREVLTTRQLAGGTLLVVGRLRSESEIAPFAVWRVETDNTLTRLRTLPGINPPYGGADLSADGTRVAIAAYVAAVLSELRVITIATGASVTLAPDARAPRWSNQGDRIAYLTPDRNDRFSTEYDGTATTIGADGSGRLTFPRLRISAGIAWSPDGRYLVGRASTPTEVPPELTVIRIADGVSVPLRFARPDGASIDYYQPDWR